MDEFPKSARRITTSFSFSKNKSVPTEFIRVKNADHMYRPYPEGAVVSPDVGELNRMSAAWFLRWLGCPEIPAIFPWLRPCP
jgi:hypothetical protein